MSTGQSMLLIGAFVLLSTLTLGVNTTIINTTTMGLEMEANLNALSYGQSLLDEIHTRVFDEAVTGGRRVFTNSDMTTVGGFGPDAGESFSGVDSSRVNTYLSQVRFDDVDDYHRYTRMVYNPRLGWFTVTCTIQYVNEDNLSVQTSQSWHKKITVSIENYSMTRTDDGNIRPYQLTDLSVYRKYY